MSRIPLVRNASAFCAAVAIASLMSVGATSAAPLFSLSAPSAGTVNLGGGTQPFDPAMSPAMAAQLAADIAFTGNNAITTYNLANPGGLFITSQPVNVTFQFIGAEAGFNNQTWVVGGSYLDICELDSEFGRLFGALFRFCPCSCAILLSVQRRQRRDRCR